MDSILWLLLFKMLWAVARGLLWGAALLLPVGCHWGWILAFTLLLGSTDTSNDGTCSCCSSACTPISNYYNCVCSANSGVNIYQRSIGTPTTLHATLTFVTEPGDTGSCSCIGISVPLTLSGAPNNCRQLFSDPTILNCWQGSTNATGCPATSPGTNPCTFPATLNSSGTWQVNFWQFTQTCVDNCGDNVTPPADSGAYHIWLDLKWFCSDGSGAGNACAGPGPGFYTCMEGSISPINLQNDIPIPMNDLLGSCFSTDCNPQSSKPYHVNITITT